PEVLVRVIVVPECGRGGANSDPAHSVRTPRASTGRRQLYRPLPAHRSIRIAARRDSHKKWWLAVRAPLRQAFRGLLAVRGSTLKPGPARVRETAPRRQPSVALSSKARRRRWSPDTRSLPGSDHPDPGSPAYRR